MRDLANGLGNLVQRTLSFIYKNCDATIVEIATQSKLNQDDADFLAKSSMKFLYEQVAPYMDQQRFDRMR